MAIKHYSYDPTASKSGAPKQISDDLAGSGYEMNPETVRKYLREAVSLVARKANKKEL
jgi:hypothetical protein